MFIESGDSTNKASVCLLNEREKKKSFIQQTTQQYLEFFDTR